jgi:hypothetical protein
VAADAQAVGKLGEERESGLRTTSEREVRNYACPRLGKTVVVSYLFEPRDVGRGDPRGVHCAGARDCGVERIGQDGATVFDWGVCTLRPDLVREGFLPP